MLTAVLIQVLYVVLVLSMLALLWAAGACYVRVRRHLAAKHEGEETQRIARAQRSAVSGQQPAGKFRV